MISSVLRSYKQRRRLAAATAEIAARPAGAGAPHCLGGELIVSLTSYPARFPTLPLTLTAIRRQSVAADRIILWLDDGDQDRLPGEVRGMTWLEVRICPPWRSYKKIVPTLLFAPGAHVVTADDDVYYGRDWLSGLVEAARNGAKIACHRGHRVVLHPARDASRSRHPNVVPAPYAQWEQNIDRPEDSPLIFPTGVSGVLYTSGVFHADVTRADLFTRLAPEADDVWLYWMQRLNGIHARKIGGRARVLEWDGSQAQCLRVQNVDNGGNDRAIAAMMREYGWPDAPPPAVELSERGSVSPVA